MTNWLITNANTVNEGQQKVQDIRIRDGRIENIGNQLTAKDNEQVFDASGLTLLPGVIDAQVHFREPGMEYKATIASESRAAVAGGVTSFMEMPNTKPPTLTAAALDDKIERAKRGSLGNFAFYFGTSNDNLDEIRKLKPGHACGLKIFMGASTGNMLVDDPKILDLIFRDAPVMIITHCEDTPMMDANLVAEQARYPGGVPIERHPYIRSREACMKSSKLAIELRERHDARLHILHISTAEELELFVPGPLANKRLTAETCVHYLHFDESDYPRLGNQIKCNPAIKSASDRLALIKAINDDRIDILATDHAPHTAEEKSQSYEKAPGGLPLVQHLVQAAFERVADGTISVEKLVQKFCHNPSILFGIPDRGYLREGYWADLTLVDTRKPQICKAADLRYHVGWSPFEGFEFKSSIVSTFVNGHRAWHQGKLDESKLGVPLTITRGRG